MQLLYSLEQSHDNRIGSAQQDGRAKYNNISILNIFDSPFDLIVYFSFSFPATCIFVFCKWKLLQKLFIDLSKHYVLGNIVHSYIIVYRRWAGKTSYVSSEVKCKTSSDDMLRVWKHWRQVRFYLYLHQDTISVRISSFIALPHNVWTSDLPIVLILCIAGCGSPHLGKTTILYW